MRKLRKVVRDREGWRAAVRGVTEPGVIKQLDKERSDFHTRRKGLSFDTCLVK